MNCRLILKYMIFVAVTLSAAILTSSCSPKKNTAATRRYQAFITKYNIYYNGETHYDETLNAMIKAYEDDYSRLLFMHPVEAYSDPKAPQPTGNFDRSIEKAQKAIQLRSITARPKKKSGKGNDPAYKEWLKREEYNPFLHNAWMMMGRSQYYNGDFSGAAATFHYTSKRFRWLTETELEARLWEAMSYCSLGWLFEAENIITRVKETELTNKTLKGLYYHVYANFLIKSGEYEKAIPYLINSIDYAEGSQKTRQRFLLGQLYALTGKKAEAYEAFKKAGSSSGASYRTKFNARIKQSEVYTGTDIEPEINALRRMTRYDRNKEYLDQIYYAIGNLYLSRQDTLNAIENYKLAIEKSTRNGIDKAICQITLGELYFARHEYDLAQPCYAEAVPLLPETYPNHQLLTRRSEVLDELAVYAQNVTLQDSLITLSLKPIKEQEAVIDEIIRQLIEKEKEEAEAAAREEYLAEQAAQGSNLQGNSASTPNTFTLNSDDSWYFYNTATKNAGKTDFQKRWGSRKLEDDWRRRNKTTFSMSDFEEGDDEAEADGGLEIPIEEGDRSLTDEQQREQEERANDPHNPEYYFKQIPQTDEERAVAHDIIQEGLYNMGLILKDKLEDFDAATSEFDRLLTNYPDNVYRLDTYYNLYLIFMRQGKTSIAERYRQLILTQFPDSPYGIAMRDTNYFENLKRMYVEQEELYARAYDAYLENRNDEVHAAYEFMTEKYPLSKIMPKFMFLHALAFVTENKPDEFNATLKLLLERYPETDITPLATSYLKQMAQGRELHSGATNLRGMIWDTRLSNDTTATAAGGPVEFDLSPDVPQLLIFTFSTDSVSSNMLLYEIARHNFNSFVVKDFDLEQMNFGRLGLVIVKGFENIEEVDHYRSVMASNSNLVLPSQVRPVVISVANFDILLRDGRSFEEYFNFVEEKNYIETEETVLPPEEFGESEGIPTDTPEPQPETEPSPVLTPEPAPVPDIEPEQPIEQPTEQVSEPQPEPTPIPTPVPEATPIPDSEIEPELPSESETEPVLEPQPTQAPASEPQPEPQPAIPEYPSGSEGDDSLFDDDV